GIAVLQPPILVTTHNASTYDYSLGNLSPYLTVWSGAFFAPVAGTYQFLLGSRHGSWLEVDGTQIINNSGRHDAVIELTAGVPLAPGLHAFKMTQYNFDGTPAVYLKWAPPSSALQLLTGTQTFTSLPIDQSAVALATSTIALGSATRTYVWNSGGSAAGPYT